MKVAAALIPIIFIAGVAHAGDRRVAIDLPAGRLGHSLALLSRQAGIDIGTADPTLQAVAVPAVRGRMTAGEALERLLRGTIGIARRRGDGWRIERRPKLPRRPPPAPVPSIEPASDIVITGSKRATRLNNYPGTATVLAASAIAPDGGPADSDALTQQLASVGTTYFGPGRNKLFVRGVIDSAFSGPSQATTGQYLNETRFTYNAPDPNLRLYDVSTVEVLEGPQGTLYGAGSLGGVIHIVTARPELDRFTGSASGGFSAMAHGELGGDVAAMLNLPLKRDELGLRLVGYADRDGGYVDNPLIGRDNVNRVTTIGARATLRARLGDWTVDLGGVVQSIRADDSPWTDAGPQGARLSRVTLGRLPYADSFHLADFTILRRWGDIELVSSSAWVGQTLGERFDASSDLTGFLVSQHERSTLLVSETRISARRANGSGWVAGVSLLDSNSVVGRIGANTAGGTSPRERAYNRVREATLFGEADLQLASGLTATAGLRLSAMEVKGDARVFLEPSTIPIFGDPVSAEGRHIETRALPSLALAWKGAPGLLLFARYQQGFRPGGFGISGIRGRPYDGDNVEEVEAGARYESPDGIFDLGLSTSWMRWRDILAEVVSLGGDPITRNIGDGDILSLEARFGLRPLPQLRIGGGLFVNRSRLTDARVASVVVRGQALPNVARIGAQASLDYSARITRRLDLTLSANLRYFGGSNIGAGPLLDAAQGDYVDDRILLRIGDTRRGVSVQVANVQDGRANRFALGTPYRIYDRQATPQQPRTIRIGFDTKF